MNSREHNGLAEMHGEKFSVYSLYSLVLFFLFFFLTQISFSQTNIEYDINDPRNPNCPCHKYQQQAEKEFAQLNNAKENNTGNNFELNTNENQHLQKTFNENGNRVVEKQVNTSIPGSKYKSKKKLFRYNKLIFRIERKLFRTKRIKPNYSICYKW